MKARHFKSRYVKVTAQTAMKSVDKKYLGHTEDIDPTQNDVSIIYKCKDDCKTILDKDHLKEM